MQQNLLPIDNNLSNSPHFGEIKCQKLPPIPVIFFLGNLKNNYSDTFSL